MIGSSRSYSWFHPNKKTNNPIYCDSFIDGISSSPVSTKGSKIHLNKAQSIINLMLDQAASHFTKHSENPRQQYSCLVSSFWTKGLTCPKSINMLSLVLEVFDQNYLHSRTMKKCVALNGNLKRYLIKSAVCKRDVLNSSGDHSAWGEHLIWWLCLMVNFGQVYSLTLITGFILALTV